MGISWVISFLISITLIVGVLNLFLALLDLFLKQIGVIPRVNLFKEMNDMHNVISDIKEDRLRNVVFNVVETSLTNNIVGMMVILTLYFCPVINLMVFKAQILSIHKKISDRERKLGG